MTIGKSGRLGPLCWRTWPGGIWVRLFGFGFTAEHVSVYRPSFSERHGISRRLHVGGYRVKMLRRMA